MTRGVFITFEGTEGSGKSTQIRRFLSRLEATGITALHLREPGGTAIGEEIRHTLKHSPHNAGMAAETELLLMNASRAQLVRERIRPALETGHWVLCDRFYDSTTVYQGYGRGLPLHSVQAIIEFAVGPTRPDLTFLLMIPVAVSESRRAARDKVQAPLRDRMEEADRSFFERVETGYRLLAAAEPHRFLLIDASRSIEEVADSIWHAFSDWRADRL